MKKAEIIQALKEGKKVRHSGFVGDESMTQLPDGSYFFEDGVKCPPDEFWRYRTEEYWEEGWEIIDESEKKDQQTDEKPDFFPPRDKWVPFQEVDFADENIKAYHVDTRDFHCLTSTELSSEMPDISKLLKYGDQFFYTAEEVVSMLTRFFNESGGKGKWRFFHLEEAANWSLKYIRMYRLPQGLLVCTERNYALNKHKTSGKVADSKTSDTH